MTLTRKELLALGALGSAALLLPMERSAMTKLTTPERLPESRLPEPFTVPFGVPPVLRPVRATDDMDYYQMTMRAARRQILPGLPKTLIYGYNGMAPGPTMISSVGRGAVVRQINGLPRTTRLGERSYKTTTSVHLHGSASQPQYDGYAEDLTPPGYYKDYRYPNTRAATIWYHDHGLHHTAENTYLGLAGLNIEQDALEQSLPLPRGYGRYDVPIAIQDKIFARDGALIFDDEGEDQLMGDIILVNGRPFPTMKVERRKYRLRLLNASVSRSYELSLSADEPMTVIGTDGGLMPEPQPVGSLLIGPAERYEIVVDFARYRIGDELILRNRSPKNNADYPSIRRIMRFEVTDEPRTTKNNVVPDTLRPNNPVMELRESEATHTERFRFRRRRGMWTIDGETWDPGRVDARCDLGQVEVWEFENRSGGWNHPIHVHLIDFRILDRNGKPPRDYERGPKDVAYVGENETVRVLAQFGPQQGKYMMHCHNVTHEDHDMMTQFEVGEGGPDPVTSDPARPVSEMTPL